MKFRTTWIALSFAWALLVAANDLHSQSEYQEMVILLKTGDGIGPDFDEAIVKIVDKVKPAKGSNKVLIEKDSKAVTGVYVIVKTKKPTNAATGTTRKATYDGNKLTPNLIQYRSGDKIEFTNLSDEILAPSGFNDSIGKGKSIFPAPKGESKLPLPIRNVASKKHAKTIGHIICVDSIQILKSNVKGTVKIKMLPSGTNVVRVWFPGLRLKIAQSIKGQKTAKYSPYLKLSHNGGRKVITCLVQFQQRKKSDSGMQSKTTGKNTTGKHSFKKSAKEKRTGKK